MTNTKLPFEENKIYHIYNHAVGNELLFASENNYLLFLKLVNKYLIKYLDIYAYCLMPNHFHFIIQTKSLFEIVNINSLKQDTEISIELSKIISKQFSHLFNSYAQTCNKERMRKGSLFNDRFKRKHISDDIYLKKLIHYIHFNPIKANICKTISEWKYSSYNAIISNENTSVFRMRVIDLFDDVDNFKYCHNEEPALSGIE